MDSMQYDQAVEASGLDMAKAGADCRSTPGLDQPRKLAVLGLPWDTSEANLRAYFSKFGALESAEIMKDRFTGKSRGFGFVTFEEPAAAQRALAIEHSIDGRRCEAKIALPKQGEQPQSRATRIFIARIPASVTESQFKAYFEKFGKLQDAYMPKDHSKQGYRGIGFVTYSTADAVEKVMACKHWLDGQEVAIDRATPKEDFILTSVFKRLAWSQRHSFDNGSGIVGPGMRSGMHAPPGVPGMAGGGMEGYGNVRSLSEDRGLSSVVGGNAEVMGDIRGAAMHGRTSMDESMKAGGRHGAAMPTVNNFNVPVNPVALHELAKAHAAMQAGVGMGTMPLSTFPADLSASLLAAGAHGANPLVQNMLNIAAAQSVHPLLAAAASSRRSLDSQTSKRGENPVIASARAGPRIFIGKLTKETTEADVKEYFMKFGYVMDVYMPKSKDNKAEHRGFGFVTFETDAAIQRVVGAGTHRLKGSTIAIDLAMPKVDEDTGVEALNDQFNSLQMAGLPYISGNRL